MDKPAPLASYVRNGPIGTLTLERPDALNAFSAQLCADSRRALALARKDRALRVLVVRGAGAHFSAGGDIKTMAANLRGRDRLGYFKREMRAMNTLIESLAGFPVPTIAAVRGVAAGGGCSLALACDLRIATPDAKFLQAFINIGLVPDTGSSYFLNRLAGLGRAMELVLLGEPLPAERALQWGLVNAVVMPDEFDATVQRWAEKLAAKSPAALKTARALVLASADRGLKATLAAESAAQTRVGGGQEFAEALAAFLEKRPAMFQAPAEPSLKTVKTPRGLRRG